MGGPRLTSLAHGGGCGCKISPAVLRSILGQTPAMGAFPDLLVGLETSDDAAVWRLNADQALVATTDFFMPVVDDPRDFGRIAATNALSDVYAMGARPLFALAIVGMPIDTLPVETIRAILEGGASVCAEAGAPVAGGHSIDSVEPIYGLVALGLAHPDRILTNRAARAGDRLILTKPLGVGILSAALRRDRLDPAGYAALIDSTTRLNALGANLPDLGVRAATDVTGFGLLGHALEMARGSGASIRIDFDALPILTEARAFAAEGIRTGASVRNWDSYGAEAQLDPALPAWARDLLCDPQTSGGLLVAAPPGIAQTVLERAHASGFAWAVDIGEVVSGAPGVSVSA